MPDPSFYRPSHSEFGTIDPAVSQALVTIVAGDGARSRGVLYIPPGRRPRTVVVRSHPSADLPQHWAAPYWTSAGYAFFSYATRYVSNYTPCIHERLVLDVAAVLHFLRNEMDFEHVVFHGQSGGASMFALYQAEASTAKGSRIAAPPGGGGPNLNDHALIPADAMIFVAGHPGQGRFLQGLIDPSVVDELDPRATDSALDMYDERNGWRQPPNESRYDKAWLAEYRAGQERRVRRLDAIARSALASSRLAKEQLASEHFKTLSREQRRALERQSQIEPVMILHRVEANPAYTDLTIDPSDRIYGSIQGDRPDIANYGSSGFGKIVTPEAWLSTWSGVSSNANLERNLPKIRQPSCFIFPMADGDIFPSAFEIQLKQSGASDKEVLRMPGVDHYLFSSGRNPFKGDPRAHAMEWIINWTRARFAP